MPSDSQSADLYKMASRILSDAGYAHYEISSYCKNGFECNHNQLIGRTNLSMVLALVQLALLADSDFLGRKT